MESQYEPTPGYLYHHGKRYVCPCGTNEFKVEIGTDPPRFWCTCGAMYTEELIYLLIMGKEDVENGI